MIFHHSSSTHPKSKVFCTTTESELVQDTLRRAGDTYRLPLTVFDPRLKQIPVTSHEPSEKNNWHHTSTCSCQRTLRHSSKAGSSRCTGQRTSRHNLQHELSRRQVERSCAPLVLSKRKAWKPMASCSQVSQASMSASSTCKSGRPLTAQHCSTCTLGDVWSMSGAKQAFSLRQRNQEEHEDGVGYPVSTPPHVQFAGQYLRCSSGGHFQSF
eukprot:761900-Hanusia_phi.AAC.3